MYPDSDTIGVFAGGENDLVFRRGTAVPWSYGEEGWDKAGYGPRSVAFRPSELDPGPAEDPLELRHRVVGDLDLTKARDPGRALLAQRPERERPVVVRGGILLGVVVDRNLQDGSVLPGRVDLPAPVLAEERGVEPELGEPVADERRNVAS